MNLVDSSGWIEYLANEEHFQNIEGVRYIEKRKQL